MPISQNERETIQAYDKIVAARRAMMTDFEFWGPEFRRTIKDFPENPRFLDLGCGEGRDARLYQIVFGNLENYLGIDLSFPTLQAAKTRVSPEKPFAQADSYDLPIASESVDIVWAVANLIHTPREQIQEPLAEIKRCLTLGGKAFFVMKWGAGEKWEIGKSPDDKRYVVYWEVANFWEELEQAGFHVDYLGLDGYRDKRGIVWLYGAATKAI